MMTQIGRDGEGLRADLRAVRASLPVRMLGWVPGALSFLNLIRDMTLVEVFGLVRQWLDLYDLLVRRITGFLFGWIDWRWIRLDDAESHVLIIGILLGGVAGRASYRTALAKGHAASAIGQTMLAIIGVGGFVALPLFLVASPVGLWIGLLFAAGILASGVVGGEWVDENYVDSRHFRREFVIAGACVALVLLVGRFLLGP